MADKSIEIGFDGTEWKVSTEGVQDEFEAADKCIWAAVSLLMETGYTKEESIKQIIAGLTQTLL